MRLVKLGYTFSVEIPDASATMTTEPIHPEKAFLKCMIEFLYGVKKISHIAIVCNVP